MPSIRLGTASPSTQDTTASTLELLASIAARAASHSIDILLLPEAFLGGYPRGTSFGCVIGERKPSGRDEYADYFDKAVDLGDVVGDGGAGAGEKWVRREFTSSSSSSSSSTTADGGREEGGVKTQQKRRGDGTREELERIARETGVFIVTGLIEKAGGSLYCAAVYVCPHLGIIGKRRKVMPVRSPPPLSILSPPFPCNHLYHSQPGV
jgi:nitrilase